MRYLKFAPLSAALLLCGLTLCQAEPSATILSASDLNAACLNDTGGSASCSVYIAGFSRGFYYAAVSGQAGYPPCIPRDVSDAEARSIVVGFMKSHSEMMQQRAPSVVAEALITAFPCSNRQQASFGSPR